MYFSSESVFNKILLLTKLLGVFPYDHVRKRISYQWFTYSLVIILVCTAQAAYVLFDPPRLAKNSLLRNILFRCQMLAMYACIVIFNGCILVHRRKISLVFLILEKLKTETRGQPNFLMVVGYFLWQSMAIAFTAYMDWHGNQPLDGAVSLALCYYYGMISIIVVGLAPFVALVQLVSTKLDHLVMALKCKISLGSGRLYSYVLLYDRMVSLLCSLNEAFSLQLLLISFVSFFNMTINMFFIADYVVNEVSAHRAKMVPVYMGWITMFSSMVIFPIYSCHRTTKQSKSKLSNVRSYFGSVQIKGLRIYYCGASFWIENKWLKRWYLNEDKEEAWRTVGGKEFQKIVERAKKAKEFNTQLYQLMIDDTTNDISNNKKLRLHIAMKREVVFTACGFFTLDYTLVHSMIAAATTYLVILIQFGQHQQHTTSEVIVDPTPFNNTTDLSLSTVTM